MAKFDKGTTLDTKDLENVAGGTYIDSMQVCHFLNQAGYDNVLKGGVLPNLDGMRSALNDMGITSNDHGGFSKGNTYTMGDKTLTQDELMKVLQDKFPNAKG
ncbi:hypothetical protein SAMN05216582_1127 [Selenomonas ruminantium]|uniref:Uncharacterized protein n=1 Tax=Selenomonas ruminantium TaxID=971 RepID=A0A1M6UE54_SELRU|nr:hypothetical protein [Selenomonas ruminantium]SHK67338.1 hypothetical protein SAMN05216582_1127 [Selenomonas ruminantium]